MQWPYVETKWGEQKWVWINGKVGKDWDRESWDTVRRKVGNENQTKPNLRKRQGKCTRWMTIGWNGTEGLNEEGKKSMQ